jgi:hypothetical protein
VRKPYRNRHFTESRSSGNGFRGRVSQVRILPGPPIFSDLTHAAEAALPCGKPSLYPLSYGPCCRGSPNPSGLL